MGKLPQKTGLGRGLSELMGDDKSIEAVVSAGASARSLPIEKLEANPYQPRRKFDEATLKELVNSVKEKGVLQPLLVRQGPNDLFQIIAGERRWRAAQQAGLHEVPVVVRELTDSEALELGIIENVQRQDLSPVEEASGYKRLMDEFGHTQEQVARMVGKSRSHIANLLRLMTLPEPVLEMLDDGKLTMGHARTLVGVKNAGTIAKLIAAKGLSVRAAEKLAMGVKGKGPDRSTSGTSSTLKDTNTRALERDISIRLGLTVEINHRGDDGGDVSIKYRTLDQLDMLCGKLRK